MKGEFINCIRIKETYTKKEVEIILAKIWECKYEEDKIFLIIADAVNYTPNDIVKKHKKALGY